MMHKIREGLVLAALLSVMLTVTVLVGWLVVCYVAWDWLIPSWRLVRIYTVVMTVLCVWVFVDALRGRV